VQALIATVAQIRKMGWDWIASIWMTARR